MTGRVQRVSGPLVEVTGLEGVAMSEVVELGRDRLPGEVVGIRDQVVSVQAYEYTGGVAVGDQVTALGRPLSAELGPELLGGVFDGLLRPLADAPVWLTADGRREGRRADWDWQPSVAVGDQTSAGAVLGIVPGPGTLEYRVLAPLDGTGTVEYVAAAGAYPADHVVVRVGGVAVSISTRWPIRVPRPVRERVASAAPLVTGQRVLDAIFPVAQGSSTAVPGGFGTGKTMLLQQIAKWCDADVIVYVGCGERGNEMADVMQELSELDDPRTGGRLAERTVVVANTRGIT